MRRSSRSALLFLAAGLIGGVLSLRSITRPMDGPPEQLAVGLTLLVSGGVLILGTYG